MSVQFSASTKKYNRKINLYDAQLMKLFIGKRHEIEGTLIL